MRVELTGRHVEISPGLRRLVDRKLQKVQRMVNDAAVSATVVVTKEAINNAVKYSQASELYLRVARSGADLNLLIEDNGKGFDASSVRPGNGLNNMKERASNIGADYSIEAGKIKGTRISLRYKIPQCGM